MGKPKESVKIKRVMISIVCFVALFITISILGPLLWGPSWLIVTITTTVYIIPICAMSLWSLNQSRKDMAKIDD